jgi:large subunit ribosomal protein L6
MSRIGKIPIIISEKITINFDKNTREFIVKGPLGELKCKIHPLVILEITAAEIKVSVQDNSKKLQKSIWGTTRAIIQNMISGVITGFSKSLELNGVGFKMELADKLTLYIGFSHTVKIEVPKNIKLKLEKNILSGTSIDKQLIGDFFTYVHDLKPCDPYKQKGFKFPGRFYLQKEGKKGASK